MAANKSVQLFSCTEMCAAVSLGAMVCMQRELGFEPRCCYCMHVRVYVCVCVCVCVCLNVCECV